MASLHASSRILLIEDSLETQILVRGILSEAHDVRCVTNIQSAKETLGRESFDLILLDVLLPDGNGFEMCQWIRSQPQHCQTPILFLTGKGEITDKVQGFELGGDDYLVKPFEPLELRARAETHLKRRTSQVGEFRAGTLRFELTKQRAFLQSGGSERELDLTPNEFRILLHLVRHNGKVLSRAEILDEVWGQSVHVQDRTVDTHVYSLRKKLGPDATLITAVPSRGYVVDISNS